MSRKSIIDPDYRKFPWKHSKYAPANSGTKNAMAKQVETATRVLVLIWIVLVSFGGVFILPPNVIDDLLNGKVEGVGVFVVWGLGLSGVFFLAFQVVYARRIYRKEEERLYALYGDVPIPRSSIPKPIPIAPRIPITPSVVENASKDSPKLDDTRYMPQSITLPVTYPSQTPQQFEHEVAHIINVGTEMKATVVGGSGDGGVDIVLLKDGVRIGVVQCKMYKGIVPPLYIRELSTVQRQLNVKRAYLVTTGTFSTSSWEEAKSLGITLIDNAKLEKLRASARAKVKEIRAKK